MLAELDTYDWEQVFGISAVACDADTSTEGVSREAVAEILARWEYQGDYAEWDGCLVGRLTDGRYVSAVGWCDTTGWGCRDGADVWVAGTLDTLLRFGLTEEARGRLNYPPLTALVEGA